MKKRKVLNLAVVLILVASTFVIFFAGDVVAQEYSGEIYATNEEGSGTENFIEGSELYFTIELDENEEVELTVSFREEDYSLIEDEVITTSDTGTYISSNEGVYFDLTNRRSGEYHLNITDPDGDYDQETIMIYTNYSSGSEINTWNTEERDEERTYYAEGMDIYFDGIVRGAYEEEVLAEEEIWVQLVHVQDDEVYHLEDFDTDEEGEFEGEFEWDDFGIVDPEPPEPGTYSLEVLYFYEEEPVDGDEVIASEEIVFYDPLVSERSTVITTEDDYDSEKNYFFDDDEIYFRADMEDQHGWPPEEEPDIEVLVEKDGEEVQTQPPNIDPNYDEDEGSFYGEFELQEYEFGNYTLQIMDDDSEEEYASTEFTVINLEVSIIPEVEDDLYTQEQDIEIRVESNYEDNITVFIADDDEVPYDIMEGAMWEDEELINNFWSTEYTIPEDEEDGTYYVIVNSTEDDETLDIMEFDIQKYYLEVTTDKEAYIPGEEVKAYYTISNLLDGSEYDDVEVEWLMEYWTEEGELNTLEGEAEDGEFSFTLPEDAAIDPIFPPPGNQQFSITVWATDAEERYYDEAFIEREVIDLDLDLDVQYDEYFVGQTLYIELETSTGNVDVEVELHHADEVVIDRNVETSDSGYYMLAMDLSGRNPGHYVVLGNATWNYMEDEDDDDFELLEESSRLSVMLETDKGENPYYPGEQGTVFYTVTHHGETVTNEANVKYTLTSDERVLDKDFADGGEIDFTVPDDYSPSVEGSMEMYVEATLDRETHGESDIDIPVVIGDIILNPDQWEYEAEDQIQFEYEFHGIGEEEIDSLEYRVLDEYNFFESEVIMSGTPTQGTFEITIPDDPASSYTVELQAVTEGGSSIETSVEISLITGFYLETEIVTESDYTTGVYQSGDEIEIHYELVPRDGNPLPEIVEVSLEIMGYPEEYRFETEETEGTITLTIPELNDGENILFITVVPRYYEMGSQNTEIIEVDSDPYWGNRIVIGGASANGLIMIILIIIALILGISALYRTRSKKTDQDKPPRQTQEMQRPPEQESGEGFHIEEGRGKQEHEWSGVKQEEGPDESQMDSEE